MHLNNIACRNFILWVGLGCICCSFAANPVELVSIFSIRGLAALVLKIFGALLAALGIREFAYGIFKNATFPWYASVNALFYLALALCIINALICAIQIKLTLFGINPVIAGYANFFMFIGLELFWAVILEWPHHVKRF
jgi:hypothetical protein